jgi:hypothetical protein
VEDRKQGKNSLYRLKDRQLIDLLHVASGEIPEAALDMKALQLVLDKRRDRVRGYFDELAGKFGRHYVPAACRTRDRGRQFREDGGVRRETGPGEWSG